jgi:glycosyltransferase involved in cell wall biosynthesis
MPVRHVRRDLAVNLAMSVVGAAAMMVALREAARLLPAIALGLLLLARRLADLLANLVQVGTPHAARRYLSLTLHKQEQRRWLTASLLMWSLAAFAFLAVLIAGQRWWTPLLFGNQVAGSGMLAATGLLAIAMAGTNLAMSALMAVRRFVSMNLLQIATTSGLLLASLWLLDGEKTPDKLVFVQGGGGLILLALALGLLYLHLRDTRSEPASPLAEYFRETFAYGAPRTLSPFLEILLIVLGPWLLRENPAAAAGLILAFTLLRLAAAFVQPLALVGGVTGARLLGSRDEAGLARGINFIIGLTGALGLVLCAAGYPWLTTGLRLWLGTTELAGTVQSFASGLLLALSPYMLFQGLKPIIEAVWHKPWMLYIMVASLALLLGVHALARQFLSPAQSVMVAVPIALAASGLGTIIPVRGLLRPATYFRWPRIIGVTLLVLLVNAATARLSIALPFAIQIAVATATIGLSLAGAMLVLTTLWPSACLSDVTRFLIPGLFPNTTREDDRRNDNRRAAARVAFLSLTHPFDDTRVLHKEARALAQAGYDVVHFAPDYGKVAPREMYGVRIVLYPPTSGPARRLRRLVRLWRLARAERADVLHSNEVESWLVALLIKLERPRTRVIFDVHEHYPSRFAEPHSPRWSRWIGEPVVRFLFRTLTPATDHLIFAKRSVAQDFPARPDQATCIFNYAPLDVPAPTRDEVSPAIRTAVGDHPVAVHIGGLSRARGWPQLLEALAHMRHRELRVMTFGEIDEGSQAFWAEADRLGVRDRVEIRERVPYNQIFEYLAAADVGLMLYQPGVLNHVYAFPIKLYDYMRAGLPAIGPRFAVEVTPVIEAEGCGWLIDTANPQELADVLDLVCDDRAAARAAGERGRQAVKRKYNWERQASRLVAVYAGLLDVAGSIWSDNWVRPATGERSTSTSAGRSEP